MDSPTLSPGSALSSNDENPRVKFLCSFMGSILPRPHDGKLRYVGGETRIVSVPRDITYEELMAKMRELFEGAVILKYQQPDEDLDALVSVVNDDDVTNMMEEYDKLGSSDGFNRLRIFLFSHLDQDGPMHFVDGDERDNERRYVDALNSLNESPDRRNHPGDNQFMGAPEDAHAGIAEQFLNQMSFEGALHNPRNADVPIPINLRQLNIPPLMSVQTQQSINQRYNEMEAPWSPAYYSPRQGVHNDLRQVTEYPTSPSSSRYRTHYVEVSGMAEEYNRNPLNHQPLYEPQQHFTENVSAFPTGNIQGDKSRYRTQYAEVSGTGMAEEYNRNPLNHQPLYEPQQHFTENVSAFPTGNIQGDKAGFPGNIMHGTNVVDPSSICDNCQVSLQRNQAYSESPWKPGEHQHFEPSSMGNGLHVGNLCAVCPPKREMFVLNTDPNLHHPYYLAEHNDPRPLYTESQNHERAWALQQQSNPHPEELRSHAPGAGRLTDHYVVDGNMSTPHGHINMADSHYVQHDDPRYIRSAPEAGNPVFHDPAFGAGSHIHVQPVDERGVRYGSPSYAYGGDNIYQVTHGHSPAAAAAHALWRNSQIPMHGGPSYDASAPPQLANGLVNPGFIRVDGNPSPRLPVGVDNQNPWVDSSLKFTAPDGTSLPEYSSGPSRQLPTVYNQENQLFYKPFLVQPQGDVLNISTPQDPSLRPDLTLQVGEKLVTIPETRNNAASVTELVRVDTSGNGGSKQAVHEAKLEDSNVGCLNHPEENMDSGIGSPESGNSNYIFPVDISSGTAKSEDGHTSGPQEKAEMLDDALTHVPELVASVKKAVIENVKEIKTEENTDRFEHDTAVKEEHQNETDAVDAQGDADVDSDNENSKRSKIELTKAEEEALNRGLQTIRNEDLEEIRELGSGTYGSVYHGKWKGSDVAIKRIKASCFAGRPSERERLISDFWKEALILSSLHHPNVVSFYGVVRDGPDGSLATVTEFMINGSLKQFLQKKDRTIDRRKRLLIAMDTAFGMEYLHGKNIVHFDLKCENLLVNMRDPHRPVCKIGDLGLSKVKQHTLVSGGVRGTLPWMAPELLSGKSNMVTEKIDVYSFGIVMWELLTGDEPYKDMHCASIIGGIVNNTLRPQIPTWCDPEWKSLMESSWASDPAERPSFSEISQKLRSMAAAMNLK